MSVFSYAEPKISTSAALTPNLQSYSYRYFEGFYRGGVYIQFASFYTFFFLPKNHNGLIYGEIKLDPRCPL